MRTTLPVSGLGPYFINQAGKLASFDPAELAPERAIEKINAPVLHLHGEAGTLIPIDQAERIAYHKKGPDSAGNGRAASLRFPSYLARLKAWHTAGKICFLRLTTPGAS